MITVRQAKGEDVHYILDLDIKCFDDPWPAEHWRLASGEVNVAVATWYGTPVGMVVFTLLETQDSMRFVSMTKLAVKESFRNRGFGTMLLQTVEDFTHEVKASGICITIPESKCTGERTPADWLAKVGFKAVGVNRKCFEAYGVSEDGYLFQRSI